jgi:sec-independent protein translocase protein TatA
MGMPSITELLVILGIVALVFGTSRIRSIGSDLGGAIRGFRSAMKDDSTASQEPAPGHDTKRESDNTHAS